MFDHPSAFAMLRVQLVAAMVIMLCAAAPADLEAADAEAAAVSIFIYLRICVG